MAEDLHLLIKSLTKAEKRLFRLQAKKDSGDPGNYVRLFDALLEMEIYDEVKLGELFAGEPLMHNFPVAKAYLYESILHSLRSVRTPPSPEGKIRRLLEDVTLLHGKGLLKQALKVVEKGLKFSHEMEIPSGTAEFLRWKRRLVNVETARDRMVLLDEIEQEESLALEQLLLDGKLRSIRAKVQSLMARQADLSVKAEMEDLNQLMLNPVLLTPTDELPFHSRQTLWNIRGIWKRMLHQNHESLFFFRLACDDWERHAKILKALPDQYLNVLVTFLDTALSAHNFADFRLKQAGFNYISPSEPRLKAQVFYYQMHLSLRYSLVTGDFITGIKAAKALENGLKIHREFLNLSVELSLLYNLTSIHFLNREYREGLRFILLILNRQVGELRHDIFDATRLLEIVTHFELGNFDLLESLLRSQERRIRINARIAPFESLVNQGIRKLMGLPPQEYPQQFREMSAKLESDISENSLIGREEITVWIRSKLEGKLPAEIIRQGVSNH